VALHSPNYLHVPAICQHLCAVSRPQHMHTTMKSATLSFHPGSPDLPPCPLLPRPGQDFSPPVACEQALEKFPEHGRVELGEQMGRVSEQTKRGATF